MIRATIIGFVVACAPVLRASAAPCLEATRNDGLKSLSLADGHATVCYGDYADPAASSKCVSLDAATGTVLETVEEPAYVGNIALPPAFYVASDATSGSICDAADHCRPIAHDLAVHLKQLSADGSRGFALAVESGDGGADEIWAELYDTHTGHRTARMKLTKPHYAFVDGTAPPFGGAAGRAQVPAVDASYSHPVRFVGRSVIVGELAAGPGGEFVLVDPARGRMLYLHDTKDSELLLDHGILLAIDNKKLSLVDTETVAVVAAFRLPGDSGPIEEPAALASRLDHRVLIASSRPPAVAWLDPARRTLSKPHAIALCAADP